MKMDPNLWNGLKSSQAASRTGVVSGPELTLSLQSSLSQPAINNAVNLEIWALLDRQQRIAAASGFTAGFLPQPAILTPSYGTNASFGSQYAAPNSLYHYNTLPVGQQVLAASYDTSNLLTNQQQAFSKNVSLTAAGNLYKAASLTQPTTSDGATASNVRPAPKVEAASQIKKPVSYSFISDQTSRPSAPSQPTNNMANNIGLGPGFSGARMSTSQIPTMSSSLNQSGFATNGLTYGHIIDSVTSQPSMLSVANCSQTTLRPADSGRFVLAPSDISYDQLSANLCLDLSQFNKPDGKTYEQNFQTQDFMMLNAENVLSFGQPCEVMSAINIASNKETATLSSSHSQQTKQHEVASQGTSVPWSTNAQYCEQQDSGSLSRNIGMTGPAVSYEAVSPPPSTEAQSFSFVDSLHLYSDGVQVKDILSSAYDLSENPIYVKNLFDMPLIYASQAPAGDGNSQVSTALMPFSLQAVVPSSDGCRLDQTTKLLACQENAGDRSRRQKTKPTTEVGVVLPMPQNKSSKPISSNPLLVEFETSASIENPVQRHSCNEMIQYGGDLTHQSRALLQNYKPDAQQKMTSSDVASQGKLSGVAGGVTGGRNEIPSDAHNSPIVLTNITGNVYVNQYTMLQPGSMPLLGQGTPFQSVAHYDPSLKNEQDKADAKSCSVLLVPNEHDDEFGHLSVDPFVKQSAACRPADGVNQSSSSVPLVQIASSGSIVLPKSKAVNSAFESSYVNFVHGHKSETLSSVTNSPIKNKPVLPKYIPEVRRPRSDIDKITSEAFVSAGNQKSNAASGNAAKCDNVSKSNNTGTVSNNSVTDSIAVASSFLPANATKFPTKFPPKLLCKAHFLNESAKASNADTAEKEKSELPAEFKWKKILRAESNESNRSNVVSPTKQPSCQGTKRRHSTATEPSESSAAKPLQVQWTVSKKSKLKKNETADIPILVIKAVSSNSSDEKSSLASNTKPAQSKISNSAAAKGSAK